MRSKWALSIVFFVFGLMALSLGACGTFLPEDEHKCKVDSDCPANYLCDKTKTVWECKPIECIPECTDKCCGDDGCNGTCPDNCTAGYHCDPTTCRCTTDCTPECTDKCCGDDGCNGTCPDNCTAGYNCDPTTCRCITCTPQCTGKCCGDDGCNGTCPDNCTAGYNCNPTTCLCTTDCIPQCTNKCCGDDGCNGTCPDNCTAGYNCDPTTCLCTADCTPECTGKCCGDDGCDGTCPNNCAAGYHCNPTTCRCDSDINNCTDPVNQIGCGAGENCVPTGGDELACVTAGNGGPGASCDGNDDCQAGLVCTNHQGNIHCAKMCNFDQQTGCDVDWTCWGLVGINTWGVCILCTPECTGKCCGDDGCGGTCPNNCTAGNHCNPTTCLCASGICDPMNQYGCGAGENCVPTSGDELACVTAGTGGQGASCVQNVDCQVGLMCIGVVGGDIICAKICNHDQQTGCAFGLVCKNIGGVNTWGVCLEP